MNEFWASDMLKVKLVRLPDGRIAMLEGDKASLFADEVRKFISGIQGLPASRGAVALTYLVLHLPQLCGAKCFGVCGVYIKQWKWEAKLVAMVVQWPSGVEGSLEKAWFSRCAP